MSIFCKRLKDARKAAGISQERLGLLAGIEPATVSLIAGVLNVPPSYFYSEDDEEARLLVMFHRMNSAERVQILDLAAGQQDSR